jgi:hypothetical protein
MPRAKAQLFLFVMPSPAAVVADVDDVAEVEPAEPVWTCERMDRTGAARYVHLIRHPDDPERSPRPKGGVADKAPHVTLDKTTLRQWKPQLRRQLSDGIPRTFNRLCVELLGFTADVAFNTPVDEALWWLVRFGEVEHTTKAPILFRRRDVRVATCKPCRDEHSHHDHHQGVWARADGSEPVVCLCPKCEA